MMIFKMEIGTEQNQYRIILNNTNIQFLEMQTTYLSLQNPQHDGFVNTPRTLSLQTCACVRVYDSPK